MRDLRVNHIGDSGEIYVTVLSPKPQGSHSHQFFEMVYVLEGKAYHTLDGEKIMIQKGDYFIIDYDSYHHYDYIKGQNFRIINCLFRPEFIDYGLKDCRKFRSLLNHYLLRTSFSSLSYNPTQIILHDTDESILFLMKRIVKEFTDELSGNLELIRCMLIQMLILSMRKIEKKEVYKTTNEEITFMLDYIDKHYAEDLSLSFFSDRFNYSPTYLSMKFKAECGMNFTEALQRARLKQALFLISTSNKTVPEIAEIIGYNDTKFFLKIFKKYTGMTPREFKKTL